VDRYYSAAFWAVLAWQRRITATRQDSHALGRNLREEVAACLLGGHGMPAEVGLAAFELIRSEGLLNGGTFDPSVFETALRTPLRVGSRLVRYRFPVVRARQLASTLAMMEQEAPPAEPTALRNWLMAFPGIGPKTASWIVRNRHADARVAILDIHLIRACQILGLFPMTVRLPRDYNQLEGTFLKLAEALGVLPGDLDAVIWYEMRLAPELVERELLGASFTHVVTTG
jgi:thermostable 8-oxoguanine DNA glycosylase